MSHNIICKISSSTALVFSWEMNKPDQSRKLGWGEVGGRLAIACNSTCFLGKEHEILSLNLEQYY